MLSTIINFSGSSQPSSLNVTRLETQISQRGNGLELSCNSMPIFMAGGNAADWLQAHGLHAPSNCSVLLGCTSTARAPWLNGKSVTFANGKLSTTERAMQRFDKELTLKS